jgi:hypothetical protein
MDSFVSATENDNLDNISQIILSTTPDVFKDFYSAIDYQSDDEENNDNIKLKYEIVLKDIIIRHLEKQLKKYEHGYNMWSGLINSI